MMDAARRAAIVVEAANLRELARASDFGGDACSRACAAMREAARESGGNVGRRAEPKLYSRWVSRLAECRSAALTFRAAALVVHVAKHHPAEPQL